jgi:hypothetical protein
VPFLLESLLPLPDQDRGAGFLPVSGFLIAEPVEGLPAPVLVEGRLMADLVEGRALLSLRGP